MFLTVRQEKAVNNRKNNDHLSCYKKDYQQSFLDIHMWLKVNFTVHIECHYFTNSHACE